MADHSVNAPCAVSHVPGPVLAYGYGGEQDRHSARPHMALPEQRGRDAGKRHIRAFWAPCCRKCWRCHRAGSLSHGAGGPEDGRGLPQAGMGWSVLQAKDDISLETEAVLGGSQFQKQGGVAGAEAG